MCTHKQTIRVLVSALAAGVAWVASPVSPASAQMGGQGTPDLSDFARAISKFVEAPPSGKAVVPSAGGVFQSGLAVPSVNPSVTARDIGRHLRVTVEKQAGPQPALAQLEAAMPQMLTELEASLVKAGFAKRDMGIALAYAFLNMYQTATKRPVPEKPSRVAAKTFAMAVAKHWGPTFSALSPAAKEKIYESLLLSTSLNTALAQQSAQAGKTQEEAVSRQMASKAFEKLIGVPPSQVKISPEGRITGRASRGVGAPVAAAAPRRPRAPARPAAKRTGPAVEGIYLIREYRMQSTGTDFTPTISYEPYLLLKDGTVYEGVPPTPLEEWDVAKSRAADPKQWGRWERQRGGGLMVRWGNGSRKEYDRGQCLRAEPAKAGERLSGVYSASSVSESRTTGSTSQLAAWSELRFFPDGRFQEGRGSSFSDSGAGGGGLIAGGRGGRSGTYTLSGYTLTRRYGDGKVVRSLFYRPTDRSIYLGATLYMRERAAP